MAFLQEREYLVGIDTSLHSGVLNGYFGALEQGPFVLISLRVSKFVREYLFRAEQTIQ
jgi:hypothetical protein